MRVGVIYDFGVNKGGGDYVMLNILDVLSDAGYDVDLITSNPSGLYEIAKFFDEKPPDVKIHEAKVPRFLKHPYTIAYISKKIAKDKRFDLYIVSDDIPKCLSEKKGICYIHFPHAARFKFQEYVADRYKRTLDGKILWLLHKCFFPKLYLGDRIPSKWFIIANSTVTRWYISKTFHVNSKDVTILNPPVDSVRIYKSWRGSAAKEDLAVCLGRFEPEKRFMDVLYAIARLKDEVKLSMIGFSRTESKLIKLIKSLGLERKVKIFINADRRTLINELIKAKAIIHPSPYEPFGIAVVEGMAAGCIPIVRRGFNGPWMEITQRGKYGLGFSSVNELSYALMNAIKHYDDFDVSAIRSRALDFDKALFKRRFLMILQNFTDSR